MLKPPDELDRVIHEVYEDDDLGLMSIADEVDEDIVVLIDGMFDSGEIKYDVYMLKRWQVDG